VPYLVECLTDVDEGRGAEAFVFQIVVDFMDYSVHLFDCFKDKFYKTVKSTIKRAKTHQRLR
jgi:hypothetical protein